MSPLSARQTQSWISSLMLFFVVRQQAHRIPDYGHSEQERKEES